MKKFRWVDNLTTDDRRWVNVYLNREGLPSSRSADNKGMKVILEDILRERPESELVIRNLESAYRARLSRRKRSGEIACVTISRKAERELTERAQKKGKKMSEILDDILTEQVSISESAKAEYFNEIFRKGKVFEKILNSADYLSGLNKRVIRHYDIGLDEAIKHALNQVSLPENVKVESVKLICESALRYLNAGSRDFVMKIEKHHADLSKECMRQLERVGYRENLRQLRYSQAVADGREEHEVT